MLASPMEEFYEVRGEGNPGKTQMRVAYVESPDKMNLVPKVFADLFRQYMEKTA
jgi:aspartate aminotransferase